jgi:predicted Zn-dependent protease
MQRMGQHMHLGVAPRHEGAVHPDPLTPNGADLIARLREPQSRRIHAALTESGQSPDGMASFLRAMTDAQGRAQIKALT